MFRNVWLFHTFSHFVKLALVIDFCGNCSRVILSMLFMAALHSRCGHYIFALWFLPIFDTWCGLSANLEWRSEMCYKRLDTGCKNDAKNRHLSAIAQLCRTISLQLRHVSTIGKKLVKQQYLLHMSPQYSELRPTNGWDWSGSHLGSVNARHSSSGRQSNCGVEQRAPPIFGRVAITFGIGPHF